MATIVRFGFPVSVWRHFESLETFPRRLLPIGDAICRFNPVFGQGMSVAAQEALLLGRLLGSRGGDPLTGLAPAFFAEACRLIEPPWASAAVRDLALSRTEGLRPRDLDARLKFGRALTRLAAEDPAVHRQMLEVQHLLKDRRLYLLPGILPDPIIIPWSAARSTSRTRRHTGMSYSGSRHPSTPAP
jgi:2-polyprenyl-6-methoxyphenol hydroxylase-like FAD-dependent oxidoreductase